MNKPLAFIIEDDPKLAKIFSITVQNVDFEIEVMNDGQSALDRLEIQIPDLILLDLHLPKCSGEEVLQEIRADARLKNAVVILATADALIAEKLQHDADLILLKPVDIAQLRTLLARFRLQITGLD